jgi:hypothetical protein
MTDAERLRLAEDALTALTDQCCGSCYWSADGSSEQCACTNQFFPTIETIRRLRKEIVES